MNFTEEFQKKLEDCGLTAIELAEKTGINIQFIRRIGWGKNTFEKLNVLYTYLNDKNNKNANRKKT